MSLPKLLAVLLFSPLLVQRALAADFVIGGGIEADSEDSIAAAVIADVAVANSTWLSGSFSKTSVELARDVDLDTVYGDVGIDHFFDPLGVRFEAAYWGDSDLLDSNDLRASLYVRKDRFSLSANVEYREFEFEIPAFDALAVRDFEFHATGYGLSGRVDVSDSVSLNFTGIDYDYNVPLERADNPGVVLLLSASRLSLINSLIDHRIGAGIGIDVGEQRWDLDFRTWKGAVGGSRTNSTTLRFLTPLGRRNDIEFGVGVDDSDDFGSVTFFSVFLYFYGGS